MDRLLTITGWTVIGAFALPFILIGLSFLGKLVFG